MIKKIMTHSYINYALILAMVLIASIVRYHRLNNGFGINMPIKTETYSVNQVVNVGNNAFCGEKGYDCLNVKVLNSDINDLDYYGDVVDLDNVEIKEKCKVLVVDLELNNMGSKPIGINCRFFQVAGRDWYALTDEWLTYAINNIGVQSTDGVAVIKSNETEIIKLAFILNAEMFDKTRFQHLDEEYIRFSLTSFPVSKQIVIR